VLLGVKDLAAYQTRQKIDSRRRTPANVKCCHARFVPRFEPKLSNAVAQVGILAVVKKALIEPFQGVQNRSPDEETGAMNPLTRPAALVVGCLTMGIARPVRARETVKKERFGERVSKAWKLSL
jgi:hypothetical protein